MAINWNEGPRIRNPIFRIHWAGWESDTLQLQRAGWQISTRQDLERRTIAFAFLHPKLGLKGLSEELDFRGMQAERRFDTYANMTIGLRYLAAEIRINAMGDHPPLAGFAPIDATPVIEEFRSYALEDLVPFAPIMAEHELVVEPEDVQEMLTLILDAQKPGQAKIRERGRKRERREERARKVHAQIVTLGAA